MRWPTGIRGYWVRSLAPMAHRCQQTEINADKPLSGQYGYGLHAHIFKCTTRSSGHVVLLHRLGFTCKVPTSSPQSRYVSPRRFLDGARLACSEIHAPSPGQRVLILRRRGPSDSKTHRKSLKHEALVGSYTWAVTPTRVHITSWQGQSLQKT
jgi:hypothetical protein